MLASLEMNFRSFPLTNSIVFLCCLMLMSLEFPVPASCVILLQNETDHLALMAFKTAITDDPFEVLSSWNSSLHLCHWVGVSCSNRPVQRVVSLNLSNQKLRGVLSSHIGNLSFLRVLNLSDNFLTGEIPRDVRRLQVLSLANNSFQGEIPMNLSYSSNIRHLDLCRNNLQGKIPIQLGSFGKATFVKLSSNNLTGLIPTSLGNLSSLQTLDLRHNNLSGTIPPDLARLQKLRELALGDNQLSGMIPLTLFNISSLSNFRVQRNYHLQGSLPSNIGLTLPNLEMLLVGDNNLTGNFPLSLLNCSKLTNLELVNNMFSGKIPRDLGRFQNLFGLFGSRNQFGTGDGSQENDLQFLSSLTNCSNLHIVSMGFNALTGPLPTSLSNFSSPLRYLHLAHNYIYGGIPSGIGNLFTLEFLSFSRNNLSGHIPHTFGKLQRLQQVFLYQNQLTDRIPSSLGNLTRLTTLSLNDNKFNGIIPSSLANCQDLLNLDLSNNSLTGTIPVQLFNLPSFSIYFGIANNHLTGPLPLQVGKLKSLVAMDVSDNKLSGAIPTTLGECVLLSYLFMQGNMFQGNIPESLSSLRGVMKLDLSRNNLTGTIPKHLGDLPFLKLLNLSFNSLEGAVPQQGKLGNASVLIVDGNFELCGGISKLSLPICPTLIPRKSRNSFRLKITALVIIVSGCLAIFAYCVVMFWRKFSTRKPSTFTSFNFRHLRISYAQLVKATNRFSEANLLGVGTFSSVYKGVLDPDGMVVAVKVINLQHQRGLRSFTSECKAFQNVRHRNLIKIFTSCSSVDFQGNDFKALVFEFMPNGNLDRWLHREADEQRQVGNISLVQRLNISIDVASAIDHLHHHSQSTILHCDLKPSNVLLDSEMTARVADFGIAKIISPVSGNLEQSQGSFLAIKGSIGYVAPEYAAGCEVSTQGDVYSYGILLLEMFIGKRPTDDMFRDGLSLHSFTNMSIPDRVMEIIDQRMLVEEHHGDRIQECLVAVLKVGVACSMESPRDRMEMGDVVVQLRSIRDVYHGIGIQRGRTSSAPATAS